MRRGRRAARWKVNIYWSTITEQWAWALYKRTSLGWAIRASQSGFPSAQEAVDDFEDFRYGTKTAEVRSSPGGGS